MLTLRRAGWRDVWRLYRWRNDPTTRAGMKSTGEIGLVEHWRWWVLACRCGDPIIYVAVSPDHGPVGTARLTHVSDSHAFCSVAIDKRYRGMGFGTEMIYQLVQLAGEIGCRFVCAEVRATNEPSMHAFQTAGFTRQFTFGQMVTWTKECRNRIGFS